MPRVWGLGTAPGISACSAGALRSQASSCSRLRHWAMPFLVLAQFSPSALHAGVGRRRSNLPPANVVRVRNLVRLGTSPDTWFTTGGYLNSSLESGVAGSVMPVMRWHDVHWLANVFQPAIAVVSAGGWNGTIWFSAQAW